MKSDYQITGIILFCCIWLPVFSQAQADSGLQVSYKRWDVKKHKGLFGLAKPHFGPYHTIAIYRLDSPVHRTKIKDPDGGAISISGSEGIDITKQQTVEKRNHYKLQLGAEADTTEAVFVIASVSKERKQTILGRMLSKNEESSSTILSYNRDVSGVLTTRSDTALWQFFIDNFTSGSRQTEEQYRNASIAAVYLKNRNDSLYTKDQYMGTSEVTLYNGAAERLASLHYNGKTPYIRMHTGVKPACQHAIATLFAVIIAIRDL
jgi:hypothetical protein